MKTIISFILIFSIFLDAYRIKLLSIDFYYYYIIQFIFVFLYFLLSKPKLNFWFIVLLVTITSISIISCLVIGYPLQPVLKQFTTILFSGLAFYLIFQFNNYNLEKIFMVYLNVAFLLSLIGVLQLIGVLLGFNLNQNYGLRISSLLLEPSHLAIALVPAFYISALSFLRNKFLFLNGLKSFIIILAYFLTFSGVAVVGFLFTVITILINNYHFFSYKFSVRRLLAIFSISIFFGTGLVLIYFNIKPVKERIDDTWNVFLNKNKEADDNLNLSSFVLYKNFMVAKEAFIKYPLFGTGLGTHFLNHDRFAKLHVVTENSSRLALNKYDANSLFLRLMSETGLMGLIVIIFFLNKNFLKYPKTLTSDFHKKIIFMNNASFVVIMLRMVRMGQYTVLGLFFFIFLYLLTNKISSSPQSIKK